MRRTVGSRPECGAAAARRRSRQVSAGGSLPRAARGLRGQGSAAPDAVRPAGRRGPADRCGRALRARAAAVAEAWPACALRGLALSRRSPLPLGRGQAAGAGRGLGAAWAPPSGAAGARNARGALGLRAAGCSLGFLPPVAAARDVGPRRLSLQPSCPPGAHSPRLVLHWPLAKAGVENRSCFFPRAPGRGPHATSALRGRSVQCSRSLPFRFPTLPSCGSSLGTRLCLFSLVAALGEGAD